MEEERSWQLFAASQGEVFERALDQVERSRFDSFIFVCNFFGSLV